MNDLVVISYQDERLGTYFESCRNDLKSFLSIECISINTHCDHNGCSKEILNEKVASLDDNYAVITYTHGNKSAVIDQDENVLICESECINYGNAVFYSIACSNAKLLGSTLINYGAKLFFGYSEDTYGLQGEQNEFIDVFVESENFALKKILLGTNDGETIYNDTYDFFTKKIKQLKEQDKSLAPLLLHNREAIQLYTNTKGVKQSFPKI